MTRDSSGKLVAIDRRAVTFSETSGARLRYGFNLSGPIGKAPVGGGGMLGGGGRGQRGTGGGGRGPGGRGMRGPGGGGGGIAAMLGGGGGQGRWNVSLYHTVRFSEQVTVAPGGPVLDLLNGDALTGGGVAEHTLELEGGVFHKGIGLRVADHYTAPTTVRSSGLPGSSDLRFSGLAGINLRLFADLGQKKALTDLSPFFKGARLSLRVDNLFDTRQRVTDGNGTVPLSYQPDYLDPKGRFIQIEFRKMF
ncbi:MAG TPA: TonB-dependent receptor [Novosphingobium sp.]|nr:TonB-dependent receptor [Novosphingobium sp.]